jgi:hypothetical protein
MPTIERFPIRARFGVDNANPSVTLIDVFSACVGPARVGSFARAWHRGGAGYGKGIGQRKSTHREFSAGNRLGFLGKPDFRTENLGMC